jgi:hypothetical protein
MRGRVSLTLAMGNLSSRQKLANSLAACAAVLTLGGNCRGVTPRKVFHGGAGRLQQRHVLDEMAVFLIICLVFLFIFSLSRTSIGCTGLFEASDGSLLIAR